MYTELKVPQTLDRQGFIMNKKHELYTSNIYIRKRWWDRVDARYLMDVYTKFLNGFMISELLSIDVYIFLDE